MTVLINILGQVKSSCIFYLNPHSPNSLGAVSAWVSTTHRITDVRIPRCLLQRLVSVLTVWVFLVSDSTIQYIHTI